MSDLGKRIYERRKQLGLSQGDLADRIGTSQKQVSRYESGENSPTAEVLVALAHALETTIDYLVGLSDDPVLRDISESDLTEDEINIIKAARAGLKNVIEIAIEIEKKRRANER